MLTCAIVTPRSSDEPGAWYACLPLHVVYHYDPIPQPRQSNTSAAAPAAAKEVQEPMQSSSSGGRNANDADDAVMDSAQQLPCGQDAVAEEDEAMSEPGPAAAAAVSGQQQQLQPRAAGQSGDGAAVSNRSSSDEGGGSSSSAAEGSGLHLTEAESARVLGSQANLWCEYVQDEETAEYMLLPRLAAMAEAVW